jgi:thymidylate synthase (FAD)
MHVELLNKENKAAELWERWGRQADITHNNENTDEARERIAKRCLNSFHWGQSENIYFDFKVDDVSVGMFMPQLLHHTIGVSHGIKSYRIPRSNIKFIVPNSIKGTYLEKIYEDYFVKSIKLYEEALAQNISAEEARSCLPLGIATSLIWCADIEAIQRLCQDRLCNRADKEIHKFALWIRKEMLSIIPELDKFLGPKCYVYGKCFEKPSCGKHISKEELMEKTSNCI